MPVNSCNICTNFEETLNNFFFLRHDFCFWHFQLGMFIGNRFSKYSTVAIFFKQNYPLLRLLHFVCSFSFNIWSSIVTNFFASTEECGKLDVSICYVFFINLLLYCWWLFCLYIKFFFGTSYITYISCIINEFNIII